MCEMILVTMIVRVAPTINIDELEGGYHFGYDRMTLPQSCGGGLRRTNFVRQSVKLSGGASIPYRTNQCRGDQVEAPRGPTYACRNSRVRGILA
jgi:hypothetical protein